MTLLFLGGGNHAKVLFKLRAVNTWHLQLVTLTYMCLLGS